MPKQKPYAPESALAKTAWRAAVNPAAVFGRSGRPYGGPGIPIVRFGFEGSGWYAPAFPTWAMRGWATECKVIAGAVKRYGEREAVGRLRWFHEVAAASEPVEAPDIEKVYEAGTVDDKLGFVALDVGPESYAATPVAYLLRRYGVDCLTWRQDWFGKAPGLLSAWLAEPSPGEGLFNAPSDVGPSCVGLIASARASCTSHEQTSG